MNKLMINYDFFEAIRNVNEPFGALKIVRNEKYKWALFNLPIYTSMNYIVFRNIILTLFGVGSWFGMLLVIRLGLGLIFDKDMYADEANDKLKKLLVQLKSLSISTDYDLLLKSEISKKKYKIELNEKKLPHILKTRYILIPSYSYNGDIKETSIQEDHIIGSKNYELSIGTPERKLKKVYSRVGV